MPATAKSGYLFHLKPEDPGVVPWTITDKPVVVGRGDTAEAFVDDEQLSRGHFLVDRQNGEFFLIDLESSNGTWVNGKKVSAFKLHGEEIIQAGASMFRFSLKPTPMVAATIPVHLLKDPRSATSQIRTA